MESPVKFLVCALFYGDHPELARRCATSLRALRPGGVDMRLGLNEVSPATEAVLDALLPGVERLRAVPQLYKYRMMRRLVHEYRGDATHLMWFDDDSCLAPGIPAAPWLEAVARRAAACTGSMGALYHSHIPASRHAWVRAQPWYTGREIPDPLPFNVGGWFVTPLPVLRRLDWPPPETNHHDGDVEYAIALHQHGLSVENFRVGLAIDAGPDLGESTALRRGDAQEVTHGR